jgi:carbonic anhydrase
MCIRFADHAALHGASWIVLEQPIEMSSAQIESFKKIFHDNHRPLQKISGREVDHESD